MYEDTHMIFIYRHSSPLAHVSYTREQYNAFRVALIRAAGLSDEWTDGDQILWHKLPPAHALESLVQKGLVGVYWLVNHSDRAGVLSPGQLVDIKNLEYYPLLVDVVPVELRSLLFDTQPGDMLVFSQRLDIGESLTRLGSLGKPAASGRSAPAGKTPSRVRRRVALPSKS